MPKLTVEKPAVSKKTTPTKKVVTSSGSIFDRMMDAAEAVTDDGIKCAFIGRSGTGKTTLAATFPKPLAHLVASNSAVGETRSIKDVPGIRVLYLQDEVDLQNFIDQQRETQYFKTCVLDHVSGYSDLVLKKILGLDQAPAALGWGTASQEQYGELAMAMKERLRNFLSLKGNIVINSQERENNVEPGTDSMIIPSVSFALTPSLAGWLSPAVDYLAYTFTRVGTEQYTRKVAGKDIVMTRDVTEWCLRVAPHPVYATKFRVPKGTKFPEGGYITDPSYDKIMALVNGKGV